MLARIVSLVFVVFVGFGLSVGGVGRLSRAVVIARPGFARRGVCLAMGVLPVLGMGGG